MKLFRLSLLAAFVVAGSIARAVTLIYPVAAIDDLWNLPADEFRQKYAGINATGLGPSDEGWYVRYRHENLTYLFGPIAEREDARKRKWDLETVRDAAIRNRATLASSQVDFVRFTFSGVYGKGGGDGGGTGNIPERLRGLGRISADGKSGPDGDLDGDGIPNALDNDMDGDGIPNDKDSDADGDGVPDDKDDYAFGTVDGKLAGEIGQLAGEGLTAGGVTGKPGPAQDAVAKGSGGKDGKGGSGGGTGDGGSDQESNRVAQNGADGTGSADGKKGGKSGSQGGQGGEMGDGSDGSSGGGQPGGKQGGRQVASNQRGNRAGQSGSQGGQSGQSGQSGQQGGGQSSSSSSSGGQPGADGGGGPPMSGGSSGGGGNPLSLVGALLKMILGL